MEWLSPDQSVSARDRAEAKLTATETNSLQPLSISASPHFPTLGQGSCNLKSTLESNRS